MLFDRPSLRKIIIDHAAEDTLRFEEVKAALGERNAKLDEMHEQNSGHMRSIESKLDELDIPAIKAGLMADQRVETRKRVVKRAAQSVVATIIFLGALVPIIQYIGGWHIVSGALKGGVGG